MIVKVRVNRVDFDRRVVSHRGRVCEGQPSDPELIWSGLSFRPILKRALSPAASDTARTPVTATRPPIGNSASDAAPAMPSPFDKRSVPRQPLFREYHVEATAFLHEIVRTAGCLEEAKAFDGEPALFFGARWRLLRAIERCGGAPTFSDCARSFRISR
jgi:hypothetical protein